MNQSPVHNVPEDPIQKEIDKLDETNKKQEGRVRNLETKAIQLVNLYFVFQGVILTSTSTASSLNCHNWWIPFVLSLLAALMNLFAFIGAISKVLESREELDQCLADLALMSSYRMTRAQINQVLPGTPFNQPQVREIVRPKPRSVTRWKRRVLAYTSVGVFIGFSAVTMYGCYTILCSSREGKCVKVC